MSDKLRAGKHLNLKRSRFPSIFGGITNHPEMCLCQRTPMILEERVQLMTLHSPASFKLNSLSSHDMTLLMALILFENEDRTKNDRIDISLLQGRLSLLPGAGIGAEGHHIKRRYWVRIYVFAPLNIDHLEDMIRSELTFDHCHCGDPKFYTRLNSFPTKYHFHNEHIQRIAKKSIYPNHSKTEIREGTYRSYRVKEISYWEQKNSAQPRGRVQDLTQDFSISLKSLE